MARQPSTNSSNASSSYEALAALEARYVGLWFDDTDPRGRFDEGAKRILDAQPPEIAARVLAQMKRMGRPIKSASSMLVSTINREALRSQQSTPMAVNLAPSSTKPDEPLGSGGFPSTERTAQHCSAGKRPSSMLSMEPPNMERPASTTHYPASSAGPSGAVQRSSWHHQEQTRQLQQPQCSDGLGHRPFPRRRLSAEDELQGVPANLRSRFDRATGSSDIAQAIGDPLEVSLWQSSAAEPSGRPLDEWMSAFGRLPWPKRHHLLVALGSLEAARAHVGIWQLSDLGSSVNSHRELEQWGRHVVQSSPHHGWPRDALLGKPSSSGFDSMKCPPSSMMAPPAGQGFLVWRGDLHISSSGELRVELRPPTLEPVGCYLQRIPTLAEGHRLLRLSLVIKRQSRSGKAPQKQQEEDSRQQQLAAAPFLDRLEKAGLALGMRLYRVLGVKPSSSKAAERSNGGVLWLYAARSRAEEDGDWGNSDLTTGANIAELLTRISGVNFRALESVNRLFLRQQLLFTPTEEVVLRGDNGDPIRVVETEDIWARDASSNKIVSEDGKGVPMTDGNGLISANLAQQLRDLHDSEIGRWPIVWQLRIYGGPGRLAGAMYKGTLTVCDDKEVVPRNTVILRRGSMRKVPPFSLRPSDSEPEMDSILCDSFTIHVNKHSSTNTSAPMSPALPYLLTAGGVPEDCFLSLAVQALEKTSDVTTDRGAAIRAAQTYRPFDNTLNHILLSDVPLNEPFVRERLEVLQNETLSNLRKGKLPVPDTYRVKGIPDPSGTIPEGQIALCGSGGLERTGETCLVYHDPGIHPGDIRKAQVVSNLIGNKLAKCVASGEHAVIFSTQGRRSMADCIAGADFDGDEFWLCFYPPLVQGFSESSPREEPPQAGEAQQPRSSAFGGRPTGHGERQNPQLANVGLIRYLLGTHQTNDMTMKISANCWYNLADRFSPHHDMCRRLCVETYYASIDATKHGHEVHVPQELNAAKRMTPSWHSKVPGKIKGASGRGGEFMSSSILARLNSRIDSYDRQRRTTGQDLPQLHGTARQKTTAELFLLQGTTEESRVRLREKWMELHAQWKAEWTALLGGDGPTGDDSDQRAIGRSMSTRSITRKYQEELWQGRTDMAQDVLEEASALYQVCFMMSSGRKLNMAWKVAARELIAICNINMGQRPVHVSAQYLSATGNMQPIRRCLVRRITRRAQMGPRQWVQELDSSASDDDQDADMMPWH